MNERAFHPGGAPYAFSLECLNRQALALRYGLHMLRFMFLAVFVVALACCGTTYWDTYTCEFPDIPHVDANGEPDPCHERDPDAGDADAGDADAGDADAVDADAGDAGSD